MQYAHQFKYSRSAFTAAITPQNMVKLARRKGLRIDARRKKGGTVTLR
jgi:hypothetical protein